MITSCGSHTRPSINRSTSKDEEHSSASSSRACEPGEHSAILRARTKRRGKKFVTAEIMISERPAEAKDRAVPGHWEGDHIVRLESSAIGTLVERTSRFTMLLHFPRMEATATNLGPRTARPRRPRRRGVRDAIAASITTLPEQLRRTLTWNQGAEDGSATRPAPCRDGHRHLLRPSPQPLAARHQRKHQWPPTPVLPEGHRLLETHSARTSMPSPLRSTGRPRKTLKWKTPAEALDEHLLSSQKAGVARTP